MIFLVAAPHFYLREGEGTRESQSELQEGHGEEEIERGEREGESVGVTASLMQSPMSP